MAMKTGIITYNLNERGRNHTGIERRFNGPALARYINSPSVQESVKNRDLVGYYGHWPRVKFGMAAREGGLDKGVPSIAEPAIVTTMLEATADGTIRHEAEFLDTESGAVASRMFKSRVGGFSSAIDTIKNIFYGFDYVIDPNFTGNRGYALDSASDMTDADILDAITSEYNRGLMLLLDSATDRADAMCAALEHAQAENEHLLSMLANGSGRIGGQFFRPTMTDTDQAASFASDIQAFDSASLTGVVDQNQKPDSVYQEVCEEFRIGEFG